MLPGENAAAFQALEAAMLVELAPVAALERLVVAAAWRLERAAARAAAALLAGTALVPLGRRR